MTVSLLFPDAQLVADLLVHQRLVGAINALGNGLYLICKAHFIRIDRGEIRHVRIGNLGHACCQIRRSFGPQLPVTRQDRLGALTLDKVLNRLNFGVRIGDKMVDCHNNGYAKGFQVLDVTAQVRTTFLNCRDIFWAKIRLGHPTVHLHRAYGRHADHHRRGKARLATLDIHELFGPKISAKARFGDDIIRQFQCRCRRDNRITTMRDVGKGPTVHKGRIVLERLHKIGLHRIL